MTTFKSTATFTRPSDTTPYTAADLVANSTTAGSVTPMTFSVPDGRITMARLVKSTTTATLASFSLFLYQSLPTVTNGDNGAFASIGSNFLGSIALDQTGSTFSDTAVATSVLTTPIPTSGTVYGLLKAVGGYTPASAEVFTVTLFGQT